METRSQAKLKKVSSQSRRNKLSQTAATNTSKSTKPIAQKLPKNVQEKTEKTSKKRTKKESPSLMRKLLRSLSVNKDDSLRLKGSHVKCRERFYAGHDKVARFPVPDEFVTWSAIWSDYSPVDYTADSVLKGPVWADPDIRKTNDSPVFNTVDGKIDRVSFHGNYDIIDRLPRNPQGRTGVVGRGLLGRWGPNHAADPIVTRWKVDGAGKGVSHTTSGHRVLQFVGVKRRDNGEWAIPGGMVDAGEKVSVTLRREFGEEALDTLDTSADERKHIEDKLHDLFHKGKEIYRGYVDDPRNTDNAWMETIAVNFHDEAGDSVSKFQLKAGDDAGAVAWIDVDASLNLFASHIHFIEAVPHRHNAHFT